MLINYALEVLKLQHNLLQFQIKKKTYLMMILIFQYELPYELILLINRLYLLELCHLLLLFPYVTPIEKDDHWKVSVHTFHFKGGGV